MKCVAINMKYVDARKVLFAVPRDIISSNCVSANLGTDIYSAAFIDVMNYGTRRKH